MMGVYISFFLLPLDFDRFLLDLVDVAAGVADVVSTFPFLSIDLSGVLGVLQLTLERGARPPLVLVAVAVLFANVSLNNISTVIFAYYHLRRRYYG